MVEVNSFVRTSKLICRDVGRFDALIDFSWERCYLTAKEVSDVLVELLGKGVVHRYTGRISRVDIWVGLSSLEQVVDIGWV